jgi:broad specificity phosphatase PhoE
MRHGATQANVSQPYVLQGLRPDNELIDKGVSQARAAAAALSDAPITQIYASPLKRARSTARVVAKALSLAVVAEELLVEVDVGEWTGLAWEEIEHRWPDEYRAFREAPDCHGYAGGENLTQVRDRVVPAIEALTARHRGETILVVGHGVANRVVLAHWLGVPLCYARRLPQDNGALNIVAFENGAAKVQTINLVVPEGTTTPAALRGVERRRDFKAAVG